MSLLGTSNVQDKIASDYLAQFDRPLSVSSMLKLRRWPMLQELGFNGQLGHMKNTFHGLKDFKRQMEMYSSTHWILKLAWKVISSLVLNNAMVKMLLFTSASLGEVGKLFKSIGSFEQVFAVKPDEVLDPTKVKTKIPPGMMGA